MIASSTGSVGQLGHQNHLWQFLFSNDILRQSEFGDRGSEIVIKEE